MNWNLVLRLSGFGLAMGAASVLGLTAGIELWLRLAIGVLCVTVLLGRVRRKAGVHGFFVGLIGGGIAPVVQFLISRTRPTSSTKAPGWRRRGLRTGVT
jgi:hypothetical protein